MEELYLQVNEAYSHMIDRFAARDMVGYRGAVTKYEGLCDRLDVLLSERDRQLLREARLKQIRTGPEITAALTN